MVFPRPSKAIDLLILVPILVTPPSPLFLPFLFPFPDLVLLHQTTPPVPRVLPLPVEGILITGVAPQSLPAENLRR